MGCQFSKRSNSSNHPLVPQSSSIDSQVYPDLSFYEAACRVDSDLRSFDSTLQAGTSRVINSLAVGVEVPSLSLDSLREVTGCLLDVNQQVVKVILESKKDIWKNQEIFDLVEDYFDNSLKVLDFCTALEQCLKRTRDSQLIVGLALQRFEEEQRQGLLGEKNSYSGTLQELMNFKAAGDPFTDEFFLLFQSVYKQQVLMLGKLQAKMSKLDKKLKSVKTWRKISNIILAAAFASVLICSVVAAAITAPPMVTALAAAASVPLGSMGKWFNSIWKKYENEIRGQIETISSMHFQTYIAIADLGSIRVLVDKLECEIKTMLQDANFAILEEEAVMLAVDDIKKRVNGFMQTIDNLCEHTDKCRQHINMARAVILRRIMKDPSN